MQRVALWLALLCGLPRLVAAAELPLGRIELPHGFHIGIYAAGVDNAREMTLAPDGTVFVGSRDAGKVYALINRQHAPRAERVITLARGLEMPNGVAFRDGALYVAEIPRILRYDDILRRLDHPPQPVVFRGDYPDRRHHGWKFIAFGPDGWLYVPVGAPCNVCKPAGPLFGTLTRLSPDGKRREVFARGIRNTVGFAWSPSDHVLWFTDNGRDEMGDDVPPDELDRAPRAGLDFGFPYCHGRAIADPKFGHEKPCRDFTPPVGELPAHVAALGMRFYSGSMFPASYRGNIFIAEHGSWNRTVPIGYRVVRVEVEGAHVVRKQIFASGWLSAGKTAWGRPVDVLVMPDGALLVSDDRAGVIYRIAYDRAE